MITTPDAQNDLPPPSLSPEAAFGAEYGEVEVIRKAVGYKKIKFYTQENLGWGDILLPEDIYHTQSTWFTVPNDVVEELAIPASDLVDALHGTSNLVHGLAAFLLMCDGRDLGVVIGDRTKEWFQRPYRPGVTPEAPPDDFKPTIFLYDQYSGGIGLAEALHPLFPELLRGARDRLDGCACMRGCPLLRRSGAGGGAAGRRNWQSAWWRSSSSAWPRPRTWGRKESEPPRARAGSPARSRSAKRPVPVPSVRVPSARVASSSRREPGPAAGRPARCTV